MAAELDRLGRPWRHLAMPQKRQNTAIRLFCMFVGIAVVSCAGSDIRPRDVNDLAKDACAIYWSKRNGISVDEAVRAFCIVPEILAPFLQAQKDAESSAGEESELAAKRAGVK